MTIAWYGHLRFRSAPILEVIVIAWMIAFMEYCFQVPANRIGSYVFSAAQLKVIQEVITLIVFSLFSVVYLKQQFQWNYLVAFALIVGAVCFVFMGGNNASRLQGRTKESGLKMQMVISGCNSDPHLSE